MVHLVYRKHIRRLYCGGTNPTTTVHKTCLEIRKTIFTNPIDYRNHAGSLSVRLVLTSYAMRTAYRPRIAELEDVVVIRGKYLQS